MASERIDRSTEARAHYRRGWDASKRYGEGTTSTSPLERADERGEAAAWYLGYEDQAAGRDKWSAFTTAAPAQNVDQGDENDSQNVLTWERVEAGHYVANTSTGQGDVVFTWYQVLRADHPRHVRLFPTMPASADVWRMVSPDGMGHAFDTMADAQRGAVEHYQAMRGDEPTDDAWMDEPHTPYDPHTHPAKRGDEPTPAPDYLDLLPTADRMAYDLGADEAEYNANVHGITAKLAFRYFCDAVRELGPSTEEAPNRHALYWHGCCDRLEARERDQLSERDENAWRDLPGLGLSPRHPGAPQPSGNVALDTLRKHVTGRVLTGEAEAITEVRATPDACKLTTFEHDLNRGHYFALGALVDCPTATEWDVLYDLATGFAHYYTRNMGIGIAPAWRAYVAELSELDAARTWAEVEASLPPAGWGENRDGHPTFTAHGPSWNVNPPSKEGFRAHWIARHGTSYTTWTYRADIPDAL